MAAQDNNADNNAAADGAWMTFMEELGMLRSMDSWNTLVKCVLDEVAPRHHRQILSQHITQSCQPRKEKVAGISLKHAGLDTVTEVPANGGFIVWLHLPNAYFDGDGLVIDYESSVCQSHAEAAEAACIDVFCDLITMAPKWCVITSANGDWEKTASRMCSRRLSGHMLSMLSKSAANTYKVLSCHISA